MMKNRPSRATPKGFTTVELLVAAGVIAVVLALLLPTLGRTREAAMGVGCTGQLRQIYAALVAYAQDHRGYLPRGGTSTTLDEPEVQDWYGVWIKPNLSQGDPSRSFPVYMGGQSVVDEVIVCPSNRYPKVPRVGGTYTSKGVPYVCNYEAMTQNGRARRPANLWKIRRSELIIVLDADPENWAGPGFTRISGWERIGERHQGHVHTLWADGRVEPIRKAAIQVSNVMPNEQ